MAHPRDRSSTLPAASARGISTVGVETGPTKSDAGYPQPVARLTFSLHADRFACGLFDRMLVLALVIRTLCDRSGLQPFFDQVARSALWALLVERLAPGDEVALRIAVAAVERLPALRTALHNLAFRAVRALHADRLLLDVFAVFVIAARGEFAEAAILDHQVLPASGAFFIERNVGFLLLTADLLGGFAIGIP